MTIEELYHANVDVKESQIPAEWRESFLAFIFGSACSAEVDDCGNIKEYIYYACDFKSWYLQNRQVIERDIKIDIILNENNPLI